MTFRAVLATAIAVAGAATLAGRQTQPPATQTFRTGTDVVLVDVAVREGGRAVTGLRADDFVLTDNGVRQRIDSVVTTAVPIDLTLVFDLSGNQARPWTGYEPPSKAMASIADDVGEVSRMLRADNRLRVLAIDTRVQQLRSMQAVRASDTLPVAEAGGLSALYDSLAAALLQPVEPARRHVVIARTKGLDTISSVDVAAVRAIAERSDALLHVVAMETAMDDDAGLKEFQCQLMGYCWRTRRSWVPFERRLIGRWPEHQLTPDGRALKGGAEATGGGLHQAEVLRVPTLTSAFRRTFEDFRSNYVLRYRPEGVPRQGWHDIDVSVPRSRSYAVRSRNGYFVEDPAPAPAPPPIPEIPRTLPELTTAYDRAAYRQVVAGLRQVSNPERLLRDFEEAGNPWPAAPRREAAFALELAEPALFSFRPDARDAALDLLVRFSRFVRHPLEPDAFERYWYLAALTMLEGSIRPAAVEAFAGRALERFPDEPRFVLSRAIAADQRTATRNRDAVRGASRQPSAGTHDDVRAFYGAAIAFPETGVEARIRLAWFLHRHGSTQEALTHLDAAGARPIADVSLRYLHQLFLGHVRSALDRPDEAVAAYRGALAAVPGAQSARVALMNALLMGGDRDAAETLAEQVQSESSAELDPWWSYWQGQYRLHPPAMARIRELGR